MSRDVAMRLDDSGPAVAWLSGRGELYGSLTRCGGALVRLRLDDEARPEFWAEVIIDAEALAALVRQANAPTLAAEEAEDAPDGIWEEMK